MSHDFELDSAPMAQLELPNCRLPTPDRNSDKGGRSFYFFDLDDNVMRLDTRIFLFHRETRAELGLSTRRFAEVSSLVGRSGPWREYEVDRDDLTGSFRRFRDIPSERLDGRLQPFTEDMLSTLRASPTTWRGPSWDFFFHAVYNRRPIAIITARGHYPPTMEHGLELLRRAGHIPEQPNYLGIFPVSNRDVRRSLGDPDATVPVPVLKKRAIMRAVETAMAVYGENPYHRFGMSDDDPGNIALVVEAMTELKLRYPDNAFFVIDTNQRPMKKTEILGESVAVTTVPPAEQLELFE